MTWALSPQEAKQAENICTLADLPEGQVGKLLIRRSGKVQLVLGQVTLDVTMGTPCSFLQVKLTAGWGATGKTWCCRGVAVGALGKPLPSPAPHHHVSVLPSLAGTLKK